MIKDLRLTNFQSHKKSILEFDPGVNVIIGKSDSGKTALLRALRWLIWNRPSGDAFRSDWGGVTQVEIHTWADSRHIYRIREGNTNDYYLDKEQFTAFGTNVPEEIRKAVNFAEINLQKQFDQPFLITATPGEVAAHFNKIAKLDKIDSTTKNINSWITGIKQKIKYNEGQVKSYEEEIKDYDHLDAFEVEVEVLEQLQAEKTRLVQQKQQLNSLIEDIIQVQDDIAYEQVILEDKDLVYETLDLIYKRDGLEDGPLAELTELIDEIQSTQMSIVEAKETWLDLEQKFEELFPDVCPLCNKPK